MWHVTNWLQVKYIIQTVRSGSDEFITIDDFLIERLGIL